MKSKTRLGLAAMALMVVTSPVAAQMGGYDGINFVKAVRDRDGNKATELLEARGAGVINARDGTGMTALIVAISRRDDTWSGFLLNQGADANLPASNGDTPLIAAARVGYFDVIGDLVRRRAKIDATNRGGETALIVAVQQRHSDFVKVLLELGADPDRPDSVAGYSARDYAKRDTRSRDILKMIENAKKPAAEPTGDTLDSFKLKKN